MAQAEQGLIAGVLPSLHPLSAGLMAGIRWEKKKSGGQWLEITIVHKHYIAEAAWSAPLLFATNKTRGLYDNAWPYIRNLHWDIAT